MKLFLVVNEDGFFLSHRKDIALEAKKTGYQVTIVTQNTGKREKVEALGLRMIELPLTSTGMSIGEELKTLYFLYNLYKKEKPDIVHHVGIKCILWGTLAAKWAGIKGVINAVSGLGILFSQERPSRLGKGVLFVLRYAHRQKKIKVIFQNKEDESLFLTHKIIPKKNCVFIKGSGVNLEEYKYIPEPDNEKVVVLFSARMVKEKGVFILIEAAEILREEYEDRVQFWLCGGLSSNPYAISQKKLEKCCDGRYIQWLGYRTDIKNLLQQSNIVAFPSYYREGIPRSLIEATASGRPIVTTLSVGCKDTVEEGYNGFLVPIKESKTLALRIKQLIEDKTLRQTLGRNSRIKAEQEFSLDKVIEKHLEIYKNLW